jgi:hypothetical protein
VCVCNSVVEHFKDLNIWLEQDHPQLAFSEGKKVIYMKPAKCAGTSILKGQLEKRRNKNNYIVRKRNILPFNNWLNQLTEKDLEDYFIFTFVRNPFDRVVSVWNHKIRGESKGTAERKQTLSFDNFVRNEYYHSKQKLSFGQKDGNVTNVHWLPQHIYTHCNNKCYVDYIGKVENIKEDWLFVADKLGISGKFTTPSGKPEHRRLGPKRESLDYRDYYRNKSTIKIVSEMYKKDLELFNYEF